MAYGRRQEPRRDPRRKSRRAAASRVAMTDDGQRQRTPAGLGRDNRQAVLREILLHGPLPRVAIAGRVGLTQASVSRITRALLDEGLIREPKERREGAGLPRGQVPLEIDPQGGYVLEVGIGQVVQTVTLADLGNRVVADARPVFERIEDPDLVVREVTRECRRLIGSLPDGRARLLGIFVMITATVDPATGGIVSAPYLGWGPYPLEQRLAEALDLPVRVQSMSATVSQAELLLGAARGRDNVLTVVPSLGIGAALVLDGRVIGGGRFPAGSIGLSGMTGEDGAPATLDDLASGMAVLGRLHGEDMRPGRTPVSEMARALLEAIERDRAGDPAAAGAMHAAGRELGRAVVQLTPLCPPDIVLVAGPLAMSRRYVAAVRDAVAEGIATRRIDVLASGVTGAVAGAAANCAMAIYEFLVERRPGAPGPSGAGVG